MIDGGRCFSVMTETEKVKWESSVLRLNERDRGYMNFLLNRKYHTFDEFIALSFPWEKTKEGYEYWQALSERYVLHDTLSPQKKFNNKPPEII